ncbi:heat shock protein 23-like [Vanessa cardui]|uniref:heat shock protein 23-like n=1 Tax=Vanessa cardui TaxID=171605 RepID=UPI001F140B52|nr:heat shock protein 23-like [Vanessa cardui]
MSYMPFMSDFDRHHRLPFRYAMSYIPESFLDAIDPTHLEYFPSLAKLHRFRKPIKNRFEMYLDVEDYGPDDIKVTTIEGFVVVEGEHKEKRDEYGWVKRQFHRRCPLPEGYKTKALLSQFSSDGTLTITAALVKCNKGNREALFKKRQGIAKIHAKDDSESGEDENESEKKPIKSKPAKEIIVKIEVEEKIPAEKSPDAEKEQAEAGPENNNE